MKDMLIALMFLGFSLASLGLVELLGRLRGRERR